jgi:hypothetical protein
MLTDSRDSLDRSEGMARASSLETGLQLVYSVDD